MERVMEVGVGVWGGGGSIGHGESFQSALRRIHHRREVEFNSVTHGNSYYAWQPMEARSAAAARESGGFVYGAWRPETVCIARLRAGNSSEQEKSETSLLKSAFSTNLTKKSNQIEERKSDFLHVFIGIRRDFQ